MDGGQDVMDIKLRTPDLDNIRVRDLNLPLDVLILSVSRKGRTIISHGYTKLRLGDKVTIIGPEEKLAEVMARFDG
jgi:Trk K+ transport system NAD-binding subunit